MTYIFPPPEDAGEWNDVDLSILRQLIGLELPMSYIARRLNRPTRVVSRKAQEIAMVDMLNVPRFLTH